MLFTIIFFLGNQNYFHTKNKHIVQNGIATINSEQLDKQSIIKLDGEWVFYPNILIPLSRISEIEQQPIGIQVPSKWNSLVEPNEEGLTVGTYRLLVEVPVEGQYGLYIRTIRQANRIFINGEEVGAKGNPSASFETFRVENADKYTVYAASENKLLDIVVHVANYNYSKAGILFQVEFGTKSAVENHYSKKLLLDAVVAIGYMIFGLIYLISYYQNRKRKEELLFGLFILLLGLYMSFINQKIFFQFLPSLGAVDQIRLQLGIIPFVAASLTFFVHTMYPEFIRKRVLTRITIVLGIVFFIYAITDPFTSNGTGAIILFQLIYVSGIIPVVLYNLFVLFRVLMKEVEGAHYILIFLVSLCCYSILMVVKFLFDLPMDYSELLLFVLVLYSFASLLSFRANASFSKTQKLSEELYINSQLKDEFLVTTSQELQVPLNRILHVSKSLMEGSNGPLKRKQQESIISIHNDTQRLGFLVEDLLFSSNHMAGEVSVAPCAVPITVINEVLDEIRSLLSDEVPIKLVSVLNDTLPAMYTDELRFKQVLYNLLHNSLQHTTDGHIKVTAEVRDAHMLIQVSDTGSGIPSQELEYIFDSFYRVKNERRGFGLGLSIAKNIVEKLSGEIYVTSTFGVGSTFTFTMPLAKIDDRTESTTDSTLHLLELPIFYTGKNEQTILVVDDDHVSIKLLADALTQSGYTFIAVDNGYDALEILQTHKVDCMLVDYMMSGMSGFELCKKVRKHHDILELPIIVLTSIMQHSDLMLSLHSGANDYLLKPVVVEDLLVRIQSLLAVRQSSIDAIGEEMNYLYAQVTPHFVYNTLNTIIALSYKDIKNTRSALYYLSTYFRAKLNVHYRDSMVSISEEIELVKAYLYIEKMRLDERLTIVYDIDESIDILIPALSLQPFVENAVFHGISKRKEGGKVEVSIKRDGQLIRIMIDDNGVGIPKDKLQQILEGEHSRIGLKNPLKKFKLMKSASLRLYSEEGKGTTVIILLPGVERSEHSHH